ncbi:NAD-dependent epimerase/dehydratase family protein [Actinophytocola xanthii]|uniref:Epimerase n=1 Tax=Actinophytocola xanthii TaxID=1912961 RepID=A0A1Q8CA76_9PSEU|nr:NAD-dependent epimerase/dehydratase family protein [Actinophytocola xanthii]OLF11265.1 epimerase [Actinophytocola xanthii]
MSRVVVTGGCGFIGRHLVERLVDRGEAVTVFDGAPPPHGPVTTFVAGDVLDPTALATAITADVDLVVHLAAVVGVDRYLSRPLDVIDINVTGTRNVLERAAEVGARVVVASTSEVFGKNPAVPWREDDDRLLGPTSADRWAYSSSKALTEHLTFGFVRQRGLRATILRYFNVYGPAQRPGFLISRSIHRALNRRPVVVYDDGRQTRCFTYVADVVGATLRAAESPRAVGQAFNIGSMTETTVAEAASLVASLAGPGVEVTSVNTRSALGSSYEDLQRRVPDNGKARALLGWRPTTGLTEGVAATIEWARANPWWTALPDSGADPDLAAAA